jgi:hypothetical protein
MSWAKLDDQFFAHPKIINLSKDAKLLQLAAITYCAGQLTDGLVTPGAVRMICAQVDVEAASIQELMAAGVWEADGTNYYVHDYLDYNPSGEQVRAERAATAKRVATWRENHPKRNGVTNTVRNGVSTPAPSPSPSYKEDTNVSLSEVADATHGRVDADAQEDATAPKGKRSVLFPQESEPYKLAVSLRDAIYTHSPKVKLPTSPSQIMNWAQVFDLMMRVDKRDAAEIRQAVKWATADSFWQANILSPGSLRKQYDKIAVRMRNGKAEQNGHQPQTNAIPSTIRRFGGVDD